MPLLAVHGLDTHRRNNALLIDDDTLVSAIGSHVLFVSLSTGARRYLKGVDGGGVGAVAVHPSRTLLAVGEKARDGGASGDGPCVYIYSYPELEQVQVRSGKLRAGGEVDQHAVVPVHIEATGQIAWAPRYTQVAL